MFSIHSYSSTNNSPKWFSEDDIDIHRSIERWKPTRCEKPNTKWFTLMR